MSSESSNLQAVSKFISRGLKLSGKSAYCSRVCQNQSNLLDSIWTIREKPKLKLFHGGSSAEGTTTTSSDVDRMCVLSGIKVITAKKANETDYSNLFFADSCESNPGYVRLVAAKPCELHHNDFGDFKTVLDENRNGVYLSSDKFVNFLHAKHIPPDFSYSELYYRHGPCLMVEHQNIFGYHRGTPGERLEADVAFSLICDQWPEEAKEWITRERHHDWPSQDIIDKISQQECHAVPVGDPTSKFCSQEWRLSFLLGERELIWNFNDTQIQTYIILKLLLKKYVDPVAPDQLSSYHLKTMMFWLIEEEGSSTWCEENLLTCVSHCLARLGKCIEDGIIEHYFHRRRNLLRYKLCNASERNLVLNKIETIRSQIAIYTLDGGLVVVSKVFRIWCACRNDLQLFINICSKDAELTTYFKLVKKVNDTRRLFMSQFNMYVNITACCDSLEMLLQIAEEMQKNASPDVDPSYLELMLQFLDIRIGIGYYRHSEIHSDLKSRCSLQEKCREKLIAASKVDDVSGLLYLATFYYCTNQLSLCMDTLVKAMPQTGRYLYTGRCSTQHGIEIEASKIKLSPEVPVTGTDDEVINPVFDIVFTKQDIEFVPYAIKFECALIPDYDDRFFVYHPCVYLYGLQYFSNISVGDIQVADRTLECLKQIVRDLGNTPQRFRALNLLGICYALKGDFSNALTCYISSLQATYTFNVTGLTNAAAYHVALLLFSVYVKAKKDSDCEVIYKRC